MWWPFRRRGRHAAARVVFIGRDPVPSAAWTRAVPLPDPPEAPVRLGFADGSQLELQAGDPAARALLEVADLLAGRDAPKGPGRSGSAGSFS